MGKSLSRGRLARQRACFGLGLNGGRSMLEWHWNGGRVRDFLRWENRAKIGGGVTGGVTNWGYI